MNRDKHIANYLLFIFCAISIGALSAPLSVPAQSFKASLSYLFNPALYVGAQAQERFAAMPARIQHLIKTDVENSQLREELKNLARQESEIEGLRRENERLKNEMGLKPAQDKAGRWARVMERDPLNWYRYLMVDAGKDDGVEINSPVLGVHQSTLAVVGRITEVGPKWSKVLLLSDEVSAVAAYIPAKTWEGLIEGQGGNLLRMNYLPTQVQFHMGDEVYTSVTSVIFPQDILIGTITQVFQQDSFLTFQSVGVVPAVEASELKEVLILMPQKAGPKARRGS